MAQDPLAGPGAGDGGSQGHDPFQPGQQGPALRPHQRPRLGDQPAGDAGAGIKGGQAAAQVVAGHLEPLHEGNRHGQLRGGGVDGRDQPGDPPGRGGVGQRPVVERVAVDELEHGHPQPVQPAPPTSGPGRPRPRDRQAQVGQGPGQLQGDLGPCPLDGPRPAQPEEPAAAAVIGQPVAPGRLPGGHEPQPAHGQPVLLAQDGGQRPTVQVRLDEHARSGVRARGSGGGVWLGLGGPG
jgi:hypothetical protein